MAASKFTIKNADLTLVTNQYLAEIVRDQGGRPFVLPDPLPVLYPSATVPRSTAFSVLFVSSFASDEPLREVLEAARRLNAEGVELLITGNHKKADPGLVSGASANVVFTGFLSDQDYVNWVFSVDAVMVLTTSDFVMLCGCYEAVSAGRPLITSKKRVLEDYFTGAVFVENESKEIADGIRALRRGYSAAVENSVQLRKKLLVTDCENLAQLEEALNQKETHSASGPSTGTHK